MGLLAGFVDRTRRIKTSPSQALLTGFACIILLGSILLSLPVATRDGNPVSYLDALFTATSATCVTGLVVFDTGSKWSLFGQLVILTMIQVGGLGFMTMATLIALLLGKRIGLRGRLFLQESMNQFTLSGLVRLTRYVIFLTVGIEALGALILGLRFAGIMPRGQAAYYGVFHAVSSFCNAGFDLFGPITGEFSSIMAFRTDWAVVPTMGALIILGGLGFPVIVDLTLNRNRGHLSLHTKLAVSVSLALLAVATMVIYSLEYRNPATLGELSPLERVLNSIFTAITPRTAGFNTLDTASLRPATLFFIIILMFIGASPSSTGGGIKTSTFGVLVMGIISTIRGYGDVAMFERRLPHDTVMRAVTVAALAMALVITVTMALSIIEEAPFLMVLFEATSAFGTVGLTTGITPDLSIPGRLLIIITMYVGRLGPLTIATALAQRKRANIHFAEERVMIG